MLCSLEQCVNA